MYRQFAYMYRILTRSTALVRVTADQVAMCIMSPGCEVQRVPVHLKCRTHSCIVAHIHIF